MSTYAARRDADIRATITAIDSVITSATATAVAAVPQLCMACGARVPADGPCDLWCSPMCSPEYVNLDTWLGATTTAQTVKRQRRAGLDVGGDATGRSRSRSGRFTRGEDFEGGLSVLTAVMRGMDAANAEIARQVAAMKRRREQQVQIARAEHAFHRHEMRAGIGMWVGAAALMVLGGLFALDVTWVAAVFMWTVAAGSGWVAWVSVGNARAQAAHCEICHPPCDTTTTP